MTQVNLIRLFDFYLAAMFLLSTMRRLSQYRSIAAIVFSAPGRWPRLLREMKQRADAHYEREYHQWCSFHCTPLM